MNDRAGDADPAVVRLPAEIDMSNTSQVGEQLRAAVAPGVTVVVADLTATTFCDSAGIRELVLAHAEAAASHTQVRLAVAEGGPVRRVLELIGLEGLLPLYPTVEAALAAPHERPGP